MFQFPRLPLPSLCVQLGVTGNGSRRVYPFGDPRVKGYVPLAAAYRSLSRPSAASSAKASTVCPYHLLLDGWCFTYTRGPSRAACDQMRSSLKRKISSLSRYAALKVRRGRALRTGHRAPWGATRDASGTDGDRPVKKCRCVLLAEVILPRKEVIQPHLPVRLPCYDFTPLTLHTFGTSLPRGLGRRLRVQTTRVV